MMDTPTRANTGDGTHGWRWPVVATVTALGLVAFVAVLLLRKSPEGLHPRQTLKASAVAAAANLPVEPVAVQRSAGQGPVGRFLDPARSITERVTIAQEGGLLSCLDPANRAAIAASLMDRAQPEVIRNSCATLLTEARWPDLVATLSRIASDPDDTNLFRSYAVQHLGVLLGAKAWPSQAERDAIRTSLRKSLGDGEPVVVREAMLALARVGDGEALALVEACLRDPERHHALLDQAIRIVQDRKRRDLAPAVVDVLRARNTVDPTTVAGLRLLVDWRPAGGDAILARFRSSEHPLVQEILGGR